MLLQSNSLLRQLFIDSALFDSFQATHKDNLMWKQIFFSPVGNSPPGCFVLCALIVLFMDTVPCLSS